MWSVRDAAVASALTAIGCLQMAADLAGLPRVKAFAAALHASPAPKVFTAQDGYETYAARFFVDWTDRDGRERSLEITPETYRGLRGPYNRRNAYGAAVSYAPVLAANPRTAPMLGAVTQYGLCGDAPLLRELGVDPAAVAAAARLRLVPRRRPPPDREWQLVFGGNCP